MSTEQITQKIENLDLLEGAVKAYARMTRIIANENRLKILVLLDRGPRTWTQLMFEVKVNPKVLRHHLRILRQYELIKKEKVGFAITNVGRALVKLSLGSIISKHKLAQRIAECGKVSGKGT